MGAMDDLSNGCGRSKTDVPNTRLNLGDYACYVFVSFCCLAVIYLVTLIVFIILILKNNCDDL